MGLIPNLLGGTLDCANSPLPSVRGDWRPRWSVVPPGPGRYRGLGPGGPRPEPETGGRTDRVLMDAGTPI